jgi:AcrR family transcriptional regulator
MNMQNAVPSRQQRRRSRTRAALVAAAEGLFAERSPEGISIDDIVAAADVAKGSFYNHFPDKDALAREIATSVRAQIESEVTDLNASVRDPAMRVARALNIFSRFAQRNPNRARALLHLSPSATSPDAPLNRGLRRDISSGIATSRFQKVTRDAAMLFVFGVVQASFLHALGAQVASAKRNAQQMTTLLLRGLAVDLAEAEAIASKASADIFASERSSQ